MIWFTTSFTVTVSERFPQDKSCNVVTVKPNVGLKVKVMQRKNRWSQQKEKPCPGNSRDRSLLFEEWRIPTIYTGYLDSQLALLYSPFSKVLGQPGSSVCSRLSQYF